MVVSCCLFLGAVGRVRCSLQTYQKFTVILHSIWIIIILSLANPWSQIFPVSFSLPLRLTGSPPPHTSPAASGVEVCSDDLLTHLFTHLLIYPRNSRASDVGSTLPSIDESNRAHPDVQCGRKGETWIQLLAHHDEESNCFCKKKKKKSQKSNGNLTLYSENSFPHEINIAWMPTLCKYHRQKDQLQFQGS